MVMTPCGFSIIFIPFTKSFKFGTCAKTLFPINRSAYLSSRVNSIAVLEPKNLIKVGIPAFCAASATFFAGSMPNTGMFCTLKY